MKYLFTLIFLCSSLVSFSQLKELKGELKTSSINSLEGLHVLNKTSLKYAISNLEGKFVISAKVNDTIVITGLLYKTKELIISTSEYQSENLKVYLEEAIEELDEVILGRILTGSLESDLENTDVETEINFYDLGIPGNTKLPLTQNERKLKDADAGSMASIGLGAGVNFHKLLNKISGRTKKLKEIVEIDNKEKCINRLRSDYESIIFENSDLEDRFKNEYFLFCTEDSDFLTLCNKANEIELIEFLQKKIKQYNNNRVSKEN